MSHTVQTDPTGTIARLRREHRHLFDCIDPDRAASWFENFARLAPTTDEFGEQIRGGRGESYLRAQSHLVTARAEGIERLLGFIRNGSDAPRKMVLDLLGGDGLVRRVAGMLGLTDIDILTCDLSPFMVRAAWAAGFPALLQSAEFLLARDNSVDGVFVAYGTHHIAPADRADVVREAYRVLRPGGVLVLHDFLTGSAMDVWFTDVVHPNSLTGHRYSHFTREEVHGYLAKAGFEAYEVIDAPDPYTATGATVEEAELALGRYLLDMYGLVKVTQTYGANADRWVIDRARSIFRYDTQDGGTMQLHVGYDPTIDAMRCTVPRMAIVGIGRKLR